MGRVGIDRPKIPAGRAVDANHTIRTYRDCGVVGGYLRLETSGVPFAVELPEVLLQSGACIRVVYSQ